MGLLDLNFLYCLFCYCNAATNFKYFGRTLTHQNSINEEITSRVKSGNAFYHYVQNRLSFCLLSKNIKMNIYRTVIFPVILYGCETWSLILRSVFENRVLEKIFGSKRDELKREWRRLHNKELYDLYSSPSSESSE